MNERSLEPSLDGHPRLSECAPRAAATGRTQALPEAPSEARAELSIEAESGCGGFDPAWIRGRLAEAIALVPARFGSIRARIVGDRTMSILHGRHCGDSATTDVLTFDALDDDGRIEVDIVLCLDEAARQAALRGHSVERELLLYAVHALLHCAGFDDRDEASWAAMHAEEDRILEAIAVGATFGRGAAT